ncbi:hypothetical protein [Nocardioides nanhaiensis]|uniref:Prokaryotic glutathione synthetase ATP-binding domain-containing protein n=1 Tax=Nocardioides nanhaiensis TaxID=1476871 RepID=A0ABP8VVB9_9ACTN
MSRPLVLLATFALLPDGETGGQLLVDAFAERGAEARWVAWDDPSVDWAAADAVAVRSTWDYHRRLPEFLAWARATGERTRLLNDAAVLAWNADKAYLLELPDLADPIATVPTALLDDEGLVRDLQAAIDRWGTVVVKPRTGASGTGVCVAASTDDQRLDALTPGPWLVQPLVESVRTTGETSVFVMAGSACAQVDKVPAQGTDEIRVHPSHGGSNAAVPLDPARAALAEQVVARMAAHRATELVYARVDLVQWQGEWVLSELEVIEPGLYLDLVPAVAGPFADAVLTTLASS